MQINKDINEMCAPELRKLLRAALTPKGNELCKNCIMVNDENNRLNTALAKMIEQAEKQRARL